MQSVFAEKNSPLRLPSAGPTPGVMTGIDIGKHSAKLVVARRRPHGCKVLRASCHRLSSQALESGGTLSSQLSAWLRESAEPGYRTLVASLPSSMVDYESIEMASSETSLDRQAQDALQQILGGSIAQATWDCWTTEREPDRYALHLAWTCDDFAADFANGLARQGWRCVGIDIPAQCLARAAMPADSESQSKLIVDIGGGEASFIFSEAGSCSYVRNRIQFAAHSAAETLATSLGIRADAAENLLSHWGVGLAESDEPCPIATLNTQGVAEWFQHLVYETRRTLSFLAHRYGAHTPSSILLCGGGADIRGLSNWLSWEVNLGVQQAQLPTHCTWSAAERFSPLYAQALSLAMYGAAP